MTSLRSSRRLAVALTFAAVLYALSPGRPCEARSTQPHPTAVAPARARPLDRGNVRAALARHAASFVENRGQLDRRVAFTLAGRDTSVYLTAGGFVLARTSDDRAAGPRRWTVALDFAGAAKEVRPVGLDRAPGRVSYFEGRPDAWTTDVPAYDSVAYRDVWPGVDVVFRAAGDRLKYEFVVAPGADPSRIRLACRGAAGMKIDGDGALRLETPLGALVDEAPVSYQERDGSRRPVASAYVLDPEMHSVAFRLGDYDHERPLHVDPAVVTSGFLGGSGDETASDVAVDSRGNVYVVGATTSSQAESFPVAVGPDLTFNPSHGCNGLGAAAVDAYVAKVRPDGTGLAWCGYIGGSCNQIATGVAVDAAGDVYVVGTTYSDQSSFPVAVGPVTIYTGDPRQSNAFVAKVRGDGTGLVYCGYIGSVGEDVGNGIAVDAAGNAYVVGTAGAGVGFPTVGALSSFGGAVDGFVAKVKADGSGFVYCGFVGGPIEETATAVAVDAAGSAYITGLTNSNPDSNPPFPVTVGPRLTLGGSHDAFVGKLKPDGSGFVYLGYVGGFFDDAGFGIAVDGAGAAYVVGTTNSPQASFPVLVGPDLTYNESPGHDGADAFVAKVKPDGTGLVYCGYIGGATGDSGVSIAVDSAGAAYVVGSTSSSEASFPVAGGPDSTYAGGPDSGDAFVAEVKADGSGLVFASYLGGSDDDIAAGVALDAAGSVYVVGGTLSTEATFAVVAGPSLTNKGGADGFVVKLSAGPAGPSVASVAKEGKFLVVTGANFVKGAKVLVNGTAYKAKPDPADSTTRLKSKKAAKVAMPGDSITVRNPDGSTSNAVTFGG